MNTTMKNEEPKVINENVSFICNAGGTLVNIGFGSAEDIDEDDGSPQSDTPEKSPSEKQEENTEGKEEKLTPVTEDKESIFQTETHQGKKYLCNFCGKTFSWLKQLKKHKLDVHESHRCELCHKPFIDPSSLMIHKRFRHKIYKVYHCDHCDEAFFDFRSLVKHTRTHIKCTSCQKNFLTKESFENHTCNFNNEFKCNVCHKVFVSRYLLEKHKDIHAVYKKTKCNFCDKLYRDEKKLDIHLRSEHKSSFSFNLHTCVVCKKSFYTLNGLKSHEMSHKGIICYDLGALKV